MKQQQVRFGEWSYLPDTLELCRGSVRQAVEPRVARLLEFLLDHPGELLSHDRLIEAVWDGRVVSDEAVRRAVSSLRRLLGTRDGNGIVRTIHKKGYIALFPPAPESEPAPDPHPEPLPERPPELALPAAPRRVPPRAHRQDILVAAMLVVLCLIALALGPRWLHRPQVAARPASNEEQYSLAVLPFADRGESGAPGATIALQLREALAINPVFRIVAEPAQPQLEAHRLDPRALGRLLGVRYVLGGSLRRGGARVQIVAELFDSASGTAVWSGSYERAPADLDALPRDIATDVSRALKVVLVSSEGAGVRRTPARI